MMQVNNQHGFTLVQAIFVVVVLALLGAVMARLIGVQSSTPVFAIQGARAYQAARSGLEWGAAKAGADESCNGTMAIENFNVTVSCTFQSFSEGPISPYDVYRISSTATYGSYGTPDYVTRTVEMKVGFP